MPTRIRNVLTIVGTVCGMALILAAPPGLATEPRPATEPDLATGPTRPAIRSELQTLLWPSPELLRRDQTTRVVSPAQLADRVVVVTFVTAGCGIACVIRVRDLAATAKSLPGALRARVAVLAVTLDPVRDDAPALRAFAEGLGLDPAQVSVLDNDPATAARQRAALRYPADRTEPPDTVLVFDRTGQFAMNYGANPLDRPRLVRDLAELDRFTQGVGHPPAAAPSL